MRRAGPRGPVFTRYLQSAFCLGARSAGRMRTTLLAFALFLLAPAVLIPTAAAGEQCWEHICCAAPDPVGEPGSPAYFVTSTVEEGWFTTCATVDRSASISEYAVECLVYGRC